MEDNRKPIYIDYTNDITIVMGILIFGGFMLILLFICSSDNNLINQYPNQYSNQYTSQSTGQVERSRKINTKEELYACYKNIAEGRCVNKGGVYFVGTKYYQCSDSEYRNSHRHLFYTQSERSRCSY